MELIKVTDDRAEIARIKKLYMEAFPPEERAPFRHMMRRVRQGKSELFSVYSESVWSGFTYVLRHEKLVYLFYFAMTPEQRGKGLGTETIRVLLQRYEGCRFFLALERQDPDAPNCEERIRRHRFYENCGLKDLPYLLKEVSVTYALMGVGGKVEPEEYRALIDIYRGPIMKHFLDMRIIKEKQ